MNKNNLTEETYFSQENNIKYTGSSQIKSFISCERAALAELTGEWVKEKSESLLISSYLDEKISGTLVRTKNAERSGYRPAFQSRNSIS